MSSQGTNVDHTVRSKVLYHLIQNSFVSHKHCNIYFGPPPCISKYNKLYFYSSYLDTYCFLCTLRTEYGGKAARFVCAGNHQRTLPVIKRKFQIVSKKKINNGLQKTYCKDHTVYFYENELKYWLVLLISEEKKKKERYPESVLSISHQLMNVETMVLPQVLSK